MKMFVVLESCCVRIFDKLILKGKQCNKPELWMVYRHILAFGFLLFDISSIAVPSVCDLQSLLNDICLVRDEMSECTGFGVSFFLRVLDA